MLMTTLTQKIEWLANKSRLFYLLTTLYYKNIIKREVRLAEIKPDDKILCIGGGPCPYTAIMLHQLTGAAVTVADNNTACVKKAANLIKRLGLDHAISIVCCEGEAIDCTGYTVIHLALQVSPKGKVLNHLLARAGSGVKFLVRLPKELVGGLYCDLESCPLPCHNYVEHDFYTNVGNTALYIKEGLYGAAQA